MKIDVKNFLARFAPAMMHASKSNIGAELVNVVRIYPHTPGIRVESKDYLGEMRIFGDVITQPEKEFCVDGAELMGCLKLLSGTAEFKFNAKNVEIKCGSFSARIPTFETKHFPEVLTDVPDQESMRVDGDEFAATLRLASGFVMPESMHVFHDILFTGGCVYGTDQTTLLRTDTNEIAIPFAINPALKVIRFCEVVGNASVLADGTRLLILSEDGESGFLCQQNYGAGAAENSIKNYMALVEKQGVQSEFIVPADVLKTACVRINTIVPEAKLMFTVHGNKMVVGCSGVNNSAEELIGIGAIKTEGKYSFSLSAERLIKSLTPHANHQVICKIGGRSPIIITSPGLETHTAQIEWKQ